MSEQQAKRQYPNSGIVFHNDEKLDPRHADFKGNGELDCPHCGKNLDFWVNMWKRIAKNGSDFFTLTWKIRDARPKPEKERQPHAPVSHYTEPTPQAKDDESDVPF